MPVDGTFPMFVVPQPRSKWPEVSRGHAEDGEGGKPYRCHGGDRRGRHGGQWRGGRPRGQRQRGGAVGRPGAVVRHAVSGRADLGSASFWLASSLSRIYKKKKKTWSRINTQFWSLRYTVRAWPTESAAVPPAGWEPCLRRKAWQICRLNMDDIVTAHRAQF